MSNRFIIPIVIGIIIVAGLAVFSIYLQQEEAVIEIRRATDPNFKCLEIWDMLSYKIASGESFSLTKEEQALFNTYLELECSQNVNKWAPETHKNAKFFDYIRQQP